MFMPSSHLVLHCLPQWLFSAEMQDITANCVRAVAITVAQHHQPHRGGTLVAFEDPQIKPWLLRMMIVAHGKNHSQFFSKQNTAQNYLVCKYSTGPPTLFY